MSGLFALFIAVIAFAVFAPAFKSRTPRLMFLAMIPCFGFWYWLPALNLLTVGHIGLDNFVITDSVNLACWLVLVAQLATLALLWLTVPLFALPVVSPPTQFPIQLLPHVSIASAAIYLALRFSEQGIGLLAAIATGQISARTEMDFANYSPGALASLIEFEGIVSIWVSLFCLGHLIIARRLLSFSGIETVAAITLMFVGSATRAVLLQAIFVAVMAITVRPKESQPRLKWTPARALAYSLVLAVLALVVGMAFIARFQADPGYAAAGILESLTSTVVVNNDMMRELAFVLDSIPPSFDDAEDLVILPFAYMLPTFLGFHREIPAYAILFARLRAGIDVESTGGNVFPGLVGDFWMVFGPWMPILFATFISAFAVALHNVSRTISNTDARLAYCLAMLSYLFFSFRNVHGALALVGIVGAALIWTICGLWGGRSEVQGSMRVTHRNST